MNFALQPDRTYKLKIQIIACLIQDLQYVSPVWTWGKIPPGILTFLPDGRQPLPKPKTLLLQYANLRTSFCFLDVLTEGVFSTPGDVTTKTIVVTELTNSIAITKIAVLENSLVKITDVSLKHRNVMVSTIAKTTGKSNYSFKILPLDGTCMLIQSWPFANGRFLNKP